jgi:beta-galactosidase
MSAPGPVDKPDPSLAIAPSRRTVLRTGVLGGTAVASLAALSRQPAHAAPPDLASTASLPPGGVTYNLNQNWLFDTYKTGSEDPGYNDSGFARVDLPHTVVPLSWGGWDPTTWENVWIYRKHFSGAQLTQGRVFVKFNGALVNATVYVNGTLVLPHPLPIYNKSNVYHAGGYLPWSVEVTSYINDGDDNVLAVKLDSTWLQVPPEGHSGGAESVDYLQPGGIYRDVAVVQVPDTFLSDVFANPQDVLTKDRYVGVQATLDSTAAGSATVTAELLDGTQVLATTKPVTANTVNGTTSVSLTITGIGDVTYWSPDNPKLYTVQTTVTAGSSTHTVSTTIGFRKATFADAGFYLNSDTALTKIFGLNRHQLFPYIGMAAPARLQRKDAELLRNELNCTMVRCSHYPQSPDFLDACDELGLMVWEEAPGWIYVSPDAGWRNIVRDNVHDMVIRDRSRPSVIIWGTRLDEAYETASNEDLFSAKPNNTKSIASGLDPTRQSTGAMGAYSMDYWDEDVYSHDDYKHSDGNAQLSVPLASPKGKPEKPYFVSEAVGALDGSHTYRWIDLSSTLAIQARQHAQVHNIAQGPDRYAGLLGWCGIDYASLNGGAAIWMGLKTPGVLDTFRVPKPGAAIYQSQVPTSKRLVIAPAFFWDSGENDGPGKGSMIATNCARLEIYLGTEHLTTGYPDTTNYPHLAHPPVVVDLAVSPKANPELIIEGYLTKTSTSGEKPAITLTMTADTSGDKLELTADDPSIVGDGSDATRITFQTTDFYGNHRPHDEGTVTLSLTYPGQVQPAVLVGGPSFDFATYGSVGGGFVRSLPMNGQPDSVVATVTASHPNYKTVSVPVTVTPPPSSTLFL